MRLRANERCPIHGRYDCCGRQSRFSVRSGLPKPVQKIDDPHHPRGYREICSRAELRRRKHVLLSKDPTCWLCGEKFDDYSEVELEHREPKGMGGARRDDHRDNLALAHKQCNFEKGSKRIPGTLA
jgi:hypothetical protein